MKLPRRAFLLLAVGTIALPAVEQGAIACGDVTSMRWRLGGAVACGELWETIGHPS